MAVSPRGAGGECAWPFLPRAYLRRISSPVHREPEVSPRFLDPSVQFSRGARGASSGSALRLSWCECCPTDRCAPRPLRGCGVGPAHPVRELYRPLRRLPHELGSSHVVSKRGRGSQSQSPCARWADPAHFALPLGWTTLGGKRGNGHRHPPTRNLRGVEPVV